MLNMDQYDYGEVKGRMRHGVRCCCSPCWFVQPVWTTTHPYLSGGHFGYHKHPMLTPLLVSGRVAGDDMEGYHWDPIGSGAYLPEYIFLL